MATTAKPQSTAPAPSPTKLTIIRGAAQDSGFLQKVFTQGANGISPAQIAMNLNQMLKLVGVQLPTGAQVGLDTAQIILAGGAVAKDIETGVNTLQTVGDISIGVAGITDLLSTLGLIDTEASDFIGLGANLALAIASGGANVLADIGAVLSLIKCVGDVIPSLFGSSAVAEAQAKRMLNDKIQAVIAPQVHDAASLFHQYSIGALNLFDFIGQVALNDPTQFATLFPNLATFFPSYMPIHLSATDTSSGLFSSKTDTEVATFYSLVTTRKQVQDVLVQTYLTTPMKPFESFETIAPVISLQAASVLGLILQSSASGDITMGFDFNVIGAIRGLGITPSILGDDWLFKGLQRNETDISDWESHLPYPPITLPNVQPVQASTIVNGVPFFTPDQVTQNNEAAELVTLQKKMQALDAVGDIESLLQIPEAVAILSRWANFHVDPTFYSLTQFQANLQAYNTELQSLTQELNACGPNDSATRIQLQAEIKNLVKPTTPVGEITNMKLVGASITTQNWFSPTMDTDPATPGGAQFWKYVNANYTIDLSDYWKILNVLSTMQKSNLFQDDTEVEDFQGSLTKVSDLFQSAYSFVIAKQMNIRARGFLAQNLGIPSDQLASRYDSKNNIIFYQKKAS